MQSITYIVFVFKFSYLNFAKLNLLIFSFETFHKKLHILVFLCKFQKKRTGFMRNYFITGQSCVLFDQ